MKLFKNTEKLEKLTGLCLAIIIHLVLLFYFGKIFLKYEKDKYVDNSFIQLRIPEHRAVKNIITPNASGKITKKKVYKKKKSSTVNQLVINDKNRKKETVLSDSVNVKNEIKNSLTKIDSFVLANSNIAVLKLAGKEKIKSYVPKKSKVIRKKIMSDYFNSKYPTPPYKFGERGTGNLINIPID